MLSKRIPSLLKMKPLEELPAFAPADFFQFKCELLQVTKGKKITSSKWQLPDSSALLDEPSHASVYAGWNLEGLFFHFDIEKPYQNSYFPEYHRGDCVELFIDTRDLKSSSIFTRFCHHFVFFAKAEGEVVSQEVTRFRGDDRHPLCDPADLEVTAELHRRSYELKIFIPPQCLNGYDPTSFDRLGLTYKINYDGGEMEDFIFSSKRYDLRHPNLWATCQLKRQ